MKLQHTIFICFIALLSCSKDELKTTLNEHITVTLPNALVGMPIYISLYDQDQGIFTASKAKTFTGQNDTCLFKVGKNTNYKVYASNAIGLIHSSYASVNPLTTLYQVPTLPVVNGVDFMGKCSSNIISGESAVVNTNSSALSYANVEISSRLCSLRIKVTSVYQSVKVLFLSSSTRLPQYIYPDSSKPNTGTKFINTSFLRSPSAGSSQYYDYALDMMFVPPSTGLMDFYIGDSVSISSVVVLKDIKKFSAQPNNIYILSYNMTYPPIYNTFGEPQGILEFVSMDVLPQTSPKQ